MNMMNANGHTRCAEGHRSYVKDLLGAAESSVTPEALASPHDPVDRTREGWHSSVPLTPIALATAAEPRSSAHWSSAHLRPGLPNGWPRLSWLKLRLCFMRRGRVEMVSEPKDG